MILKNNATHFWYENKADGKRRREEREQRNECVRRVNLVLDHVGRRHANQTQYDHIVDADSCTSTGSRVTCCTNTPVVNPSHAHVVCHRSSVAVFLQFREIIFVSEQITLSTPHAPYTAEACISL